MANLLYLKPRPPGLALHSYYEELLTQPIPEWKIIYLRKDYRRGETLRKLHVLADRSHITWQIANLLVPFIEVSRWVLPNADILEHLADLTYCANHLVCRSRKWVADCEHLAAFTGYFDPSLVRGHLIKRIRESSCKAIFFWSETARENCKRLLGNQFPDEKSYVSYPAVSPCFKGFKKESYEDIVRICHVGTWRTSSIENYHNFYVKGTRDFLLLLKLLAYSAPNLLNKFVVILRAWCPPLYILKLKTLGIKIKVISHLPKRSQILSLLAKSDLAVIPCHLTPVMIFIEAMSRSLPVITNDVWANNEYVAEGKSGFLVRPPEDITYYDENLTPLWFRPGFMSKLINRAVNIEYLMRHLRVLRYLLEDSNHLSLLKKRTEQFFLKSEFITDRRNRKLSRLLKQLL